MPVINDPEFGQITVRRSVRASSIRIRVNSDGTLRASIPKLAPIFLLKRLIKSSRPKLREMLDTSIPKTNYIDGQTIGKSHHLKIIQSTATSVTKKGQTITVSLAKGKHVSSPEINKKLRAVIISALKLEAKSYLPKRLSYLANQMDCTYKKVRFSHASSRWGSCSSTGTISLNIALMKLPFELIDYVIIHELAHTKQLNHSPEFWRIVEDSDPSFKHHRRIIKQESPII